MLGDENYFNKGITTHAVKICLKIAKEMRLRIAYGKCYSENLASVKVFKNGFKKIALFKNYLSMNKKKTYDMVYFQKDYKELNHSDYLNLNTKQIIVKYFLIKIMKYVHIGLGKNGTSFLQNEVFPKISNLLNIKYYNKDINHDFLSLDNYFVSFEDLVGEFFSPTTWEESLKINIEKFGKDANIIITIRNPIDYFTSMFCQSYHSFQIGPEEEFFR